MKSYVWHRTNVPYSAMLSSRISGLVTKGPSLVSHVWISWDRMESGVLRPSSSWKVHYMKIQNPRGVARLLEYPLYQNNQAETELILFKISIGYDCLQAKNLFYNCNFLSFCKISWFTIKAPATITRLSWITILCSLWPCDASFLVSTFRVVLGNTQ